VIFARLPAFFGAIVAIAIRARRIAVVPELTQVGDERAQYDFRALSRPNRFNQALDRHIVF
jgi:hypothetical protein